MGTNTQQIDNLVNLLDGYSKEHINNIINKENKMNRFYVEVPVDYVQGYIKYGHYEGYLDVPDDELEEFNKDPKSWILDNDAIELLNLEIDDFEVESVGDISEVNIL